MGYDARDFALVRDPVPSQFSGVAFCNELYHGFTPKERSECMSFQKVSEDPDSLPGKFSKERRIFFNECGNGYYEGSISFKDAKRHKRVVPIFSDECLEDKAPNTYKLLKKLRKGLRAPSSSLFGAYCENHRSIHQNEHGYLPYKEKDEDSFKGFRTSHAIAGVATLYGQLPNNQLSVGAKTRGEFLEYTCCDGLQDDSRLIVDYQFGFIYMTFGHYHRDSFALLVRSPAEIRFELMPVLSVVNATFDA
jgi:hypothetical protein